MYRFLELVDGAAITRANIQAVPELGEYGFSFGTVVAARFLPSA